MSEECRFCHKPKRDLNKHLAEWHQKEQAKEKAASVLATPKAEKLPPTSMEGLRQSAHREEERRKAAVLLKKPRDPDKEPVAPFRVTLVFDVSGKTEADVRSQFKDFLKELKDRKFKVDIAAITPQW